MLKFRHVPEQLFDLVMTPLMFTLLFTFVFGGALAGSPREYLQYFLPGILVQTVASTRSIPAWVFRPTSARASSTASASLPIWSLAPFAGLVVGDILRHLIAGAIILTIGLILGYRPEAGFPGLLAPCPAPRDRLRHGLDLHRARAPDQDADDGDDVRFTFLFPLVFASNIMVDPATMPAWLRVFVDLNPISRWRRPCGA